MLLNNFVIHNIFIFDNLKFHAGLKHEKKKTFRELRQIDRCRR